MRILKIALTVLLLIAVALTFISCGDDKSSDKKDETKKASGTTSINNVETSLTQSADASTTHAEMTTGADLNRISIGNISFVMPESFDKSEQNGVITLLPLDDDDTSDSIAVNVGADNIDMYTESNLSTVFNAAFESYGLSVANLTVKKDKFQGYGRSDVTYDLEMSGEVVASSEQISLFVDGKSYHFTFTHDTDKYYSVFNDVIDSIRID